MDWGKQFGTIKEFEREKERERERERRKEESVLEERRRKEEEDTIREVCFCSLTHTTYVCAYIVCDKHLILLSAFLHLNSCCLAADCHVCER